MMIIGSYRALLRSEPDDVFAGLGGLAGLGALPPRHDAVGAALVDIDPDRRALTYQTATDGGRPARARWAWTVHHAPGTTSGSIVLVTWVVEPRTWLGRVLLAPLRERRLRTREVPHALRALAASAARTARRRAAERALQP